MSKNLKEYSVKAGRFIYDTETKKVKLSKANGKLSVYVTSEEETHVSWVDIDTKIQQINIIVFPFDSSFTKVNNQNNTYVLKFQSNEDRYFFWLQEKIDPEIFVKEVKAVISYSLSEMEVQESPSEVNKPEAMDIQKPSKSQEKPAPKLPAADDFIKRMQANIMAANAASNRSYQQNLTHLSKIIGPQAIQIILNETNEQQKGELIEFLPDQQKNAVHLYSNIHSPQFLQALDALSDALNSQNAIPLFLELGLDQKYLKNYYGVHAFLKALQEWGNKQIKAEESKPQPQKIEEQVKKQDKSPQQK